MITHRTATIVAGGQTFCLTYSILTLWTGEDYEVTVFEEYSDSDPIQAGTPAYVERFNTNGTLANRNARVDNTLIRDLLAMLPGVVRITEEKSNG